jgi:transposase InsO family protein
MAESFVDTFKTELVADRPWRSRSELELAIVAWVGWYNNHRLHSSLGDVPPSEFEASRDYAITGTVDLSSSFDLISFSLKAR